MILKVRDSDGKIVARFPALDEADPEAGHTLLDEDTVEGTSQPGDLVVGGAIVPDLALVKERKWTEIKLERDEREQSAPFSVDGNLPGEREGSLQYPRNDGCDQRAR